jgi:hypothetical protein
MRRLSTLTMPLLSMLLLAATLPACHAVAPQKSMKDQLVGTWTVVSATTKRPDGSLQWGANPKGLVIFTENGRYSSHIMRVDRPKFASNNRLQGTPDENNAAMRGAVATFGTYSVDDANKTFTIRIEGSTYPNLEGTRSTRPFILTGDELTVTNPEPTAGGGPSQLVYRRAR